ncbi:hypothetical protein AMAG_18515 [Allomyces macrogynus ATCC 38327]|uniref:Tc1-like transposase DDE domain-containing protein n=1 Tax=Allomyces macrogynus (strain ATCC 38327) TaxID=578462 RepID=A0A0L0SD17_ALLM3|nr:hypothetical protein AMAG_18515 [Allomyces macrogynus ATCC 38327]|eukprot:KNE60332.1 hypothetical protein AMAG_18515 [Allomyces macrogynus ATCC 38327]
MAQCAAHTAQAAAVHWQVAPALPAHNPAPPVNNNPHDPVVAAIANQLAATLTSAAKGPPVHDHDMHDDGDKDKGAHDDNKMEGVHDDQMEGGDNENNGMLQFDLHAPHPNHCGCHQHKWTTEECQEIICMYFEQNLSVKQIVHLLLVGNKSAVLCIINNFESGKLVMENAVLMLEQLHWQLYDQFDVDVMKEMIAWYLREENFVLKWHMHEVMTMNSPVCIAKCHIWCKQFLEHHNFYDVLYLDESGLNLHLHHSFGRVPCGQRAVQVVLMQCGCNTLLCLCMGKRGAVHVKVLTWFNHDLVHVLAQQYPGQHKTILLDNIRFHHNCKAVVVLEQAGHHLSFLLPYSLHLNACELAFLLIKSTFKRNDPADQGPIMERIEAAAWRIMGQQAVGWIHEVNCWVQAAMCGEWMGHAHNAPVPAAGAVVTAGVGAGAAGVGEAAGAAEGGAGAGAV